MKWLRTALRWLLMLPDETCFRCGNDAPGKLLFTQVGRDSAGYQHFCNDCTSRQIIPPQGGSASAPPKTTSVKS